MTGSSTLFSSYKHCDGEVKITMVDGSSLIVAGIGNLNLFGLKLKCVLHVSSLKYNLISTSKLTKNQNYTVAFFLLIVNLRICLRGR